MSNNFIITGFFYEACGYKLRMHLDIKRAGVEKTTPDLMVILMNPGSSRPIDGIDNNLIPSEATPDATQYQIMDVMDLASLDFARILNLSDIRTSDSVELYNFIKSEE